MTALYDTIGLNYANLRREDPRIAAHLHAALGDAETVLNVGAGGGSYEPRDRQVTAVEPSAQMIAQRPDTGVQVVQAVAEALPFPDRSFDAAMAVLTIHHWSDKAHGLVEIRRVTRGPIAILTYDPDFPGFWLMDYFPALIALDQGQMPAVGDFRTALGPVEAHAIPIPHDCTDGFLAAYWRRPSAYLDKRARAAISAFWALGDISGGLQQLQADLDSGAWAQRNAGILDLDALDCGYRLVVTT